VVCGSCREYEEHQSVASQTEERVEQEEPRHEKIRFRRDEITDLASLPSAVSDGDPPPPRERKPQSKSGPRLKLRIPGRVLKVGGGIVGGILALLLVAIGGLYAVGLTGVGSERLRTAAEAALRQVVGVDVDAAMGPARITLDGLRFLALEVNDVDLKRASDKQQVAQAGSVRFGVRILPLLFGDVKVSSARLSDARIFTAALRGADRTDWTKPFRNERGLVDPGRVATTVFSSAHRALDAVGKNAIRRVELDDVELVLPSKGSTTSIRLVEAEMSEAPGDGLGFSAKIEIASRSIAVELSAKRDAATNRISELKLTALAPSTEEPEAKGSRLGTIELGLDGSEAGEQGHINTSVKVDDWAADLGARGLVSGILDFEGRIATDTDRMEIGRLDTLVGRSQFGFRGTAGPRAATAQDTDEPAYGFTLASPRSMISPDGSPEPAMNAAVQVVGSYRPDVALLAADQIVVKSSGPGEALGRAALRFAEGVVPGISVAFSVHDMPVSQVKQLWPWFTARPARNWVLNNVFGGRVTEGRLQFQVPPGRFGNGQPMSPSESFGTFAVTDTRFDTAGLIPPVRDATGIIDYRGNDVDIALSAGTVFMPSGRSVAASNGKLKITRANVPPVIGSLDIDVAGEAAAVAELASYDPINALRHVGLTPDEFTGGQVTGNVKADIPLQKGIDRGRLGWLVALNYEGLAISKPIDGQLVTDAKGTIVVEKSHAVIAATAKLSDMPAELDIVEPLGDSAIERKRLITLTLDDKAREKVVPGLDELIDGPIKVVVDAQGGGKRLIKADLKRAQVNIPWAGWSKGSGVGGNVSFLLETVEGRSTLSDFKFEGETFGIDGSLALAGGALSEARFSRVRLNRNDNFAVTVKKSGKGYAVDVTGKSFDARSVVKQFTADSDTATKAAASGGSVSVNADVDSITGFSDETLSNVELAYRGSGSRVERLDVTATTASGGAVKLNNGIVDGGRSMRMTSSDAGAVLRFLDLYEHMQRGTIDLALRGGMEGAMRGQVDARNFTVIDDPHLRSIVSTTPPGSDRSLSQAVKRDIDTSRVPFEHLFSKIEKGPKYLKLSEGVLRGSLVGASFQGLLYDPKGNIDMTGTFMPAYGLNRLFGEIPIIGILLGNGRDRGLIGVTFKLEGDADQPNVQVNPLSAIAPGIFRSIFEYR
jgi:hypothetical protein